MAEHTITDASESSFAADVLEASADKPVLVDFWAEWCGPCKAVAPVLEELAGKLGEKASVVKVDVDAHGSLAQEHGVSSIPTVVVFKDGKEVQRAIGAMQVNDYEALLKPYLG